MLNGIVIEDEIATNKISARLNTIESSIKGLEQKLEVTGAKSTKIYSDYAEQMRRIEENVAERFRLMGQEIQHLKGVTYPDYLDNKISELINEIYTVRNQYAAIDNKMNKFIQGHFFEIVTVQEVIQFVKMSGVTLKELADEVGMEISGISRLLSGERVKENPQICHSIKQYCLRKMDEKK